MTAAKLIMVLSDVSVGYGSPQIPSLARSLGNLFHCPALVIEPDQPDRPPVELGLENVSQERIYTLTHPYTWSGHVEYGLACASQIDRLKPDVLVVCAFLGIGALVSMKHKPRLVIYYAIEHTSGEMPAHRQLFNAVAAKIDLCIFPEENRAILDAPRLGLEHTPKVIVYNASEALPTVVPAEARNKRFFYGGTIHPTRTYADHFLLGDLDKYPIDLFGNLEGFASPGDIVNDLAARASNVTYGGYLRGGATYLKRLADYSYSIIIWNPEKEDTLYAAPNKFFDAIAAGVPPICAPHPMCEKLIQRYRCGILLDGWSLSDMKRGFDAALAAMTPPRFEELVSNCILARDALSWSRQFETAAGEITKILKQKGQLPMLDQVIRPTSKTGSA